MSCIGIVSKKLNVAIVGLIVATTVPSHALDRLLKPEEEAKLKENIKANPKNTKSRRFLIEHYEKTKEWQELIAIAAPAYEELPKEDIIFLTQAYVKNNQGDDALTTLKFYHDKNDPTPESKYLEGLAHSVNISPGEKDPERKKLTLTSAAVAFKESIKLEPKQDDAYMGWIDMLETHTDNSEQEILIVYRRYEEKNKLQPRHIAHMCQLNYGASFLKEAIESCTQAITLFPEEVESYIFLAMTKEDLKKTEEAKKQYVTTVSRFPASFLAQSSVADFYLNEKNWLKAREHYDQAIKLNTTIPSPYLGLAESLFHLDKYKEALAAYTKNCQLSKKVAPEFKSAMDRVRDKPKLHKAYEASISSCKPE